MKLWKKKMGMTMLASAIALGGLATVELANPVSKASAASGYGASVNTTKANHYVGTDSYLDIRIKNDSKDFEVQLRMQPQILKNGVWVNILLKMYMLIQVLMCTFKLAFILVLLGKVIHLSIAKRNAL
ncbi:hypothetical protein ACFMB7_26095 [Bacillus toyonensis]